MVLPTLANALTVDRSLLSQPFQSAHLALVKERICRSKGTVPSRNPNENMAIIKSTLEIWVCNSHILALIKSIAFW